MPHDRFIVIPVVMLLRALVMSWRIFRSLWPEFTAEDWTCPICVPEVRALCCYISLDPILIVFAVMIGLLMLDTFYCEN